jgi:hypothetical protein
VPRWGHSNWETYCWFSSNVSSGRKTAIILTKWLTRSSVCHGGQERPGSGSDQSPLNTHYTVIKSCTRWNDIFRKLKTYTRENKFFRYRDVHWRKWLFRVSLCWLEGLATPLSTIVERQSTSFVHSSELMSMTKWLPSQFPLTLHGYSDLDPKEKQFTNIISYPLDA